MMGKKEFDNKGAMAGLMDRELVTKLFKYRDIFGNHFNYRHQVDNNNNWRHYPISVERTWATKYWPGRCQAYFLALTEVNTNYLRG